MSLHFTVNPRDGGVSAEACNTCCCSFLSLMPGETNKVTISYAPWSVPIGGRGLLCAPDIEVEVNAAGCPAQTVTAGSPPGNTNYFYQTPLNTALATGNLASNATPIAGIFTYAKVGLSGPTNGVLDLNSATGAFTYTPNSGFIGRDRFYYKMTDNVGRSTVHEIVIEVSQTIGNVFGTFRDMVLIDRTKVTVDNRYHTISFPITLSPAARSCEVYRVNIKQQAMDCDGVCYAHISCYDINAGRC